MLQITAKTKITDDKMDNQNFVKALTAYVENNSTSGIKLTGEDVPGENFDLWLGGSTSSWSIQKLDAADIVSLWDEQVIDWAK